MCRNRSLRNYRYFHFSVANRTGAITPFLSIENNFISFIVFAFIENIFSLSAICFVSLNGGICWMKFFIRPSPVVVLFHYFPLWRNPSTPRSRMYSNQFLNLDVFSHFFNKRMYSQPARISHEVICISIIRCSRTIASLLISTVWCNGNDNVNLLVVPPYWHRNYTRRFHATVVLHVRNAAVCIQNVHILLPRTWVMFFDDSNHTLSLVSF